MALSWATSLQRAWIPCSLITRFKDIKETSENQLLVYHSIFSMFIFMQANAIHLDVFSTIKSFQSESLPLTT